MNSSNVTLAKIRLLSNTDYKTIKHFKRFKLTQSTFRICMEIVFVSELLQNLKHICTSNHKFYGLSLSCFLSITFYYPPEISKHT